MYHRLEFNGKNYFYNIFDNMLITGIYIYIDIFFEKENFLYHISVLYGDEIIIIFYILYDTSKQCELQIFKC